MHNVIGQDPKAKALVFMQVKKIALLQLLKIMLKIVIQKKGKAVKRLSLISKVIE